MNLRGTAQTVPWTVVTVNMANRVQRIQGIALVDAKKGGQEKDAIYVNNIYLDLHLQMSSLIKKTVCAIRCYSCITSDWVKRSE